MSIKCLLTCRQQIKHSKHVDQKIGATIAHALHQASAGVSLRGDATIAVSKVDRKNNRKRTIVIAVSVNIPCAIHDTLNKPDRESLHPRHGRWVEASLSQRPPQ